MNLFSVPCRHRLPSDLTLPEQPNHRSLVFDEPNQHKSGKSGGNVIIAESNPLRIHFKLIKLRSTGGEIQGETQPESSQARNSGGDKNIATSRLTGYPCHRLARMFATKYPSGENKTFPNPDRCQKTWSFNWTVSLSVSASPGGTIWRKAPWSPPDSRRQV